MLTILDMTSAQCFDFFALEILKLFSSVFSFENVLRRICDAKLFEAIFNLRMEGKTWKDIDFGFEQKED